MTFMAWVDRNVVLPPEGQDQYAVLAFNVGEDAVPLKPQEGSQIFQVYDCLQTAEQAHNVNEAGPWCLMKTPQSSLHTEEQLLDVGFFDERIQNYCQRCPYPPLRVCLYTWHSPCRKCIEVLKDCWDIYHGDIPTWVLCFDEYYTLRRLGTESNPRRFMDPNCFQDEEHAQKTLLQELTPAWQLYHRYDQVSAS